MQPTTNALATSLAAVGLVAALGLDCAASVAILNQHVGAGLITHMLASLLWLAARQQVTGGRTHRGSLTRLFATEAGMGWCITVCLFPTVGMISEAIAVLTNGLFAAPTHPDDGPITEDESQSDILELVGHELHQPFDPRVQRAAKPLASRFASASVPEKRAAIDLICRSRHPRGMVLVRQLLSDTDPDVRALAAMAVDRLNLDDAEEALQQ